MSSVLSADRDWSEDFSEENGKYKNNCRDCKKEFRGYKSRIYCMPCYDLRAKEVQSLTAIRCLYLEAPELVVNDVSLKINTMIEAYKKTISELRVELKNK